MIGTITTPVGLTATLNDDGKWESDTPALAALLQEQCDPNRPDSVGGRSPYGYTAVVDAARLTGGTFTHAKPLPPLPPGAVS